MLTKGPFQIRVVNAPKSSPDAYSSFQVSHMIITGSDGGGEGGREGAGWRGGGGGGGGGEKGGRGREGGGREGGS